MNISPETICERLGFPALNDLQEQTLQAFSGKEDLVLLAPTGSGKTVAFLLPLSNTLDEQKSGIQALIIAPSRELVLQTEQVFRKMVTGFKVLSVYGGHSIKNEQQSLLHPPALLIATPGRLADLLNRRLIDLSGVHTLVLDEFDKALEMGFQPDLEQILGTMPKVKKRLLVSATNLEEIPAFTGIRNPLHIQSEGHLERIITLRQLVTEETEKAEALIALIGELPAVQTIIFCNHRESVVRIGDLMQEAGLEFVSFHGGMEQDERERALFRFRNGSAFYLISTDLAGRGIDIPEVDQIIHYQLPANEATLIHRNGRTGRRSGKGNVCLIRTKTEQLPAFIGDITEIQLSGKTTKPLRPEWKTIYIGGGRKEKINKVDVLGFLVKTGGLEASDIGLIQVSDHSCLVAVRATKSSAMLQRVFKEKIKGKRVKIAYSR